MLGKPEPKKKKIELARCQQPRLKFDIFFHRDVTFQSQGKAEKVFVVAHGEKNAVNLRLICKALRSMVCVEREALRL
jgi:hypothetical protein